ncbi:hypothetical protein ACFL20_03565 [Spirochaetota bacterium]
MSEKKFLENFVKPSSGRFNKEFKLDLPKIRGLKKNGEFIVQGRLEKTTSTNIIIKYESASQKIKLKDVYKNTENKASGVFIRLVGSMSIFKTGFPFLFLDAAVTNVNIQTGEKGDMITRVAVHFPQASEEKRKLVYEKLSQLADAEGIKYDTKANPSMPDFWGEVWMAGSDGFDFDKINKLRQFAWQAYETVLVKKDMNDNFDYKPMQDHMIYKHSLNEHMIFKKFGLSVSAEAQGAFFGIFTSNF